MRNSLSHPARHDLFPTSVYQWQIGDPKKLNSNLVQAIRSEQSLDATGIERSNFSKLGGWHSRTDLQERPEYLQISQIIRDASQQIATDLNYKKDRRMDIDTMWAIVNSPGASNQAHVHPGALWSGVYYVASGKNAGCIEFTDPRTQNVMQQPKVEKRRSSGVQTAVRFEPTAGRLLIFPSWLYHSVLPNLSKEERIILSFNIIQS